MTDDLTPELAAFAAECRAVEDTLHQVPPDAWARPALGEWTLHELAAHLVRQADRLDVYGAAPTPAAQHPAADRVSYFDGTADLAADVAQRARAQAEGVPPAEWSQRFGSAWRASVARFGEIGPERLVPTVKGPLAALEFLATRVLEVTVHHMDVRAALDLPPTPTPEGGRLTMAILEARLDQPRPRAMGRTRFILAATGRLPTDDPRFPLLS